MSMLDIFRSDAFSLRRMTDAINKRPFVPGRIGAMNLFRASGIDTVAAQIEEKNGILYLVPSTPRGTAGVQNKNETRKMIPINTVHLPVEDRLMADEVQGVRAFGSENQFETIQGKVEEKLQTIRQSLEATHEWHRVGAIKGVQYDANGTSVLNDFFTIFNITQRPVVHFNFADVTDADAGVIRKLCNGIVRNIEDDLGATPYQYVHAFVGADFMDGITDNAETHEAWKRWQDGEALRASWVRRMFPYAGIMFEEYRGKVGDVDFIESNEARFFPVGAPDLFRTVFAPSTFLSDVNQMGLPTYSKVVVDPAERWIDILAQSNPLHYCTRPRVLRQGLTAS